ncbi:MAG TPA: hypothetical protein VGD80_36850 [Kofleriaceae bacterium]
MTKDLRGDVAGRPDDTARHRDVARRRHTLGHHGARLVEDGGHAEVADPGDAVLPEQDILGLEVSVHETRSVCSRQAARRLQVHDHDVAP